jgi:proline iminopeptidase
MSRSNIPKDSNIFGAGNDKPKRRPLSSSRHRPADNDIFAAPAPAAAPTAASAASSDSQQSQDPRPRSSTRRHQAPGGRSNIDLFGSDAHGPPPTRTAHGKAVPKAKNRQSQDEYKAGGLGKKRSAVKLHHPSGGPSNVNIFASGPTPVDQHIGQSVPQRSSGRGAVHDPNTVSMNSPFSQSRAAPGPVTAAPSRAQAPAKSSGDYKDEPVPAGLRGLYPPIDPYNTGMLSVDGGHNLYYEECGNPDGQPVVFVHGGPGGGCSENDRRFFNPDVYRIVLFDQRGCGRSTPFASLENNTTWHLVDDIDTLREHLQIQRWVVFGGSWGSCLALAYAQTFKERVKGLILRGIFTLRDEELYWFYQHGAHMLFPDAWDGYLAPVDPLDRSNMIAAYYNLLTGDDESAMYNAARAWTTWEMSTARLLMDPDYIAKGAEDKFALAFARIECHYFFNSGFFENDGFLIDNAKDLEGIPGVIVQGRYDVVCPMKTAWDLHQRWGSSELIVVPDAGHSTKEPGVASELVKACDRFAALK